ncbi:MAG: site-specific DNA-methyltransferase [Verrucomicrobiota bacterium]
MDLLRRLPSNSVDLTVTSPPYCMGKEYERTDHLRHFVEAHLRILPEIIRVTKTGGSICWQVGYHVRNGVVTPLDFLVNDLMRQWPQVILRNRIIWTFGHGLHGSNRFSGRHETILWYTKGNDYKFNLDDMRVPQKYPGKRYYKGIKKGKFSCNPLGKNPGDVWELPNIKANHIEKTDHPCQFPVALVQRLIRGLTDRGDLVLDPFLGSGTTAAAAILESRRVLGAELNLKYFRVAVERCRQAQHGMLVYRPLGQPIYVPSPNAEVATNPFTKNGNRVRRTSAAVIIGPSTKAASRCKQESTDISLGKSEHPRSSSQIRAVARRNGKA